MRLEIKFDENLIPSVYTNYSKFIYRQMKRQVHLIVLKNYKKYQIREDLVRNCGLIKWKGDPSPLDLVRYVENCLQLVKDKGVYVVRINPYLRVKNSYTPIATLVKILEYGTEKIPELPILRRVFMYYRLHYKYLFVEYMKERYSG